MIALPEKRGTTKRGAQKCVSGWKREVSTRTQLSFRSTRALSVLPARFVSQRELWGRNQPGKQGWRELSVRMRQ